MMIRIRMMMMRSRIRMMIMRSRIRMMIMIMMMMMMMMMRSRIRMMMMMQSRIMIMNQWCWWGDLEKSVLLKEKNCSRSSEREYMRREWLRNGWIRNQFQKMIKFLKGVFAKNIRGYRLTSKIFNGNCYLSYFYLFNL